MNTTAIPRQILARRVWLCDLDGTLVDSAPAHAAAYRAALEEYAPELLAGFRYDAHAGATTREVMAGLGVDPDTAGRLARRKQDLYRSYVDRGMVALFPGVHRLMDILTGRGDRVYVVTSGSRGSVDRVLASCGLDDRVAGVLTGDDIASGKPDPAAYREACRRWAVDPDDVVVLEDSPHGVASAAGAGLVTLRVHADRPLPGAIPVPSLDHLADLLSAHPAGRVCAVIPAAGRGTRLGLGVPKILLEIAEGTTVWHLLHRRLSPVVAHTHVVVSPTAEAAFRRTAGTVGVSVSVQDRPRGMGDAIFGAEAHWRRGAAILVVWGDQANLSADTVERVVATHRRGGGRRLTLPLVSMPDPYVEYELGPGGLIRVRQSREGDACTPGGLSDVGVFCLSTDGLAEAWQKYLAVADLGATTGEVNFLPFLPYLSQVEGWSVDVVPVADASEARGVNTVEDLEFARQNYLGSPT